MARDNSSLNLSSRNSMVNTQSESSVSHYQEIQAPRYLRTLQEYGVILCTEHQTCYTLNNLQEHLKRKHNIKGKRYQEIQGWITEENIPTTTIQPADYGAFIPGLAQERGFLCSNVSCNFRSPSEERIQRHCSKAHGLSSRQKQRNQKAYSRVTLQTLFIAKPEYFIVNLDNSTVPPSSPPTPSHVTANISAPQTPIRSSSQQHQLYNTPTVSSAISIRIRDAEERRKERYQQVGEPDHVSELTPWNRVSGYVGHLAGIDGAAIEAALEVPRQLYDNIRLHHLISSISRVLHKAYQLVPSLHHVDAKRLNTFQVGTMSQDPFQPVQNKESFHDYIVVYQQLTCYFIHVQEGVFGRDVFTITNEQDEYLYSAWNIIGQITTIADKIQHHNQSSTNEEDGDDHESHSDREEEINDDTIHHLETQLDGSVLEFLVALVEQSSDDKFESAVASFCAAKGCQITVDEPKLITWKTEADASKLFSQLIYCGQLVILQKARNTADELGLKSIEEPLKELCIQWILSDSRGPMGTLLNWRLYAMKVAATSIPPAMVQWDSDGVHLVYNDLRYGIPDLSREIVYNLQQAQEIFEDELCLGATDIPTYEIQDIQDNWANSFPGYSFVSDSRNAIYFEDHQSWLVNHIARNPELTKIVFHTEQEEYTPGEWPVRSEFARQFQISNDKFLGHLCVLVHKGSGQPARRNEFLSLRWCNGSMARRNLRIIKGQLAFIIDYHKSQTRTHASRSPVRFIYPAVHQLVLRYLVLINPFRELLSQTEIPRIVSDYLWSRSDGKPWDEDHFTQTLLSTSHRCLGRKVSAQAWRQICISIAVKCFSGQKYEADLDLPGNDDDLRTETLNADGVTLPVSFHAQSAHSANTGNRAYAISVNFDGKLTDAGIDVYLWTSKLWWTLFEEAVEANLRGKRPRPLSMSGITSSVVKRVAHRVRGARHLRRWGSETVMTALQRLYRDPDARFRSPIQQEMVESVAARHAEIIIVLATGGGKSLAFLVPIFFPQAATTVVIVPLVALKQDMVRRCWDAEVEFARWDGHGSSDRYQGIPLLFVSTEQAVTEAFHRFLGMMDASGQLDRLVFDEAHLILTASSYRPKMALLRRLRAYRCQVVFSSATLPPTLMQDFTQRMLLEEPHIIRDITFRSDLSYRVRPAHERGDFQDYTVQFAQRAIATLEQDESRARVIIYVEDRDQGRQLAEKLECECYFSDSGTTEEKAQVMARWREGVFRVIVATSAFGMGVDYAHVRMVIHHGLPRDAINFAQEVGRLGRDGQGGTSVIGLPFSHRGIDDETWIREQHTTRVSERVMQRYVSGSRCLWATLSRYIDGAPYMQYCEEESPCSICRTRRQCHQKGDTDHTLYWDRVPTVEVTGTPHQRERGRNDWDGRDEGSEEEEAEDESDGDDLDEEEGGVLGKYIGRMASQQTARALVGGSQRLQDSERMIGQQRAWYVEQCQRWVGTCLICHLLHGQGGFDLTIIDTVFAPHPPYKLYNPKPIYVIPHLCDPAHADWLKSPG